MTEFTPSQDPMSTLFFLALRAGARVVCEVAASYDGWQPAMTAHNVDAELATVLTRPERERLYATVSDILADRTAGPVPSPFAPSGPVTT